MLVFTTSTISPPPPHPYPTPPQSPSPEISLLCQRICSLRQTTTKWFTAVKQSNAVKRLQSIMDRLHATRRRDYDVEATGVIVSHAPASGANTKEDADMSSLVTEAACSEQVAAIVIESSTAGMCFIHLGPDNH
ncbi:hypothetical protein ONZ45_g15126 [Pleurotus djamor]|nr:hypothetical protein ONZ45_g15126 [Pleurotus djamor]